MVDCIRRKQICATSATGFLAGHDSIAKVLTSTTINIYIVISTAIGGFDTRRERLVGFVYDTEAAKATNTIM